MTHCPTILIKMMYILVPVHSIVVLHLVLFVYTWSKNEFVDVSGLLLNISILMEEKY